MKKVFLGLILLGLVAVIAWNGVIYYDNYFPFGRMRETPGVRPQEEPLLVMESGLVPFKGGEMTYRVSDPNTLKAPFPVDVTAPISTATEP